MGSQTPAPATQLYHALDGREVLKWALLEAGKKLAEYGLFSKAMAYHNPRFKLTLEIEAFDVSTTYVQGSVSATETGAKVTTQAPGGNSVVIKAPVVMEGPAKEPDKIRDKIEEGRYYTKKVGEIMVDVKEDRKEGWDRIGMKNPDFKDKGEKK